MDGKYFPSTTELVTPTYSKKTVGGTISVDLKKTTKYETNKTECWEFSIDLLWIIVIQKLTNENLKIEISYGIRKDIQSYQLSRQKNLENNQS